MGGHAAPDAAFEALVAEHAHGLARFALALVRDPGRADDLVQETFLRALERREQLRDSAAGGAWLRRILHNLALDRARRSAHELLVEDVEERWHADDWSVDAATVTANAESRAELEDALVHLPFGIRAVVLLHDVEGLTVQEIADALEIGLPAAKQRLRRGRMAMVTALAEGAERRQALAGVPLRCWDARRHVSDLMDGDAAEATTAMLRRHLETCPTCPPLYAALVGVRATMGRLRDPDSVVDPRLADRIAGALTRRTGPEPPAKIPLQGDETSDPDGHTAGTPNPQ